MVIVATDILTINQLRSEYLQSLPHFQELYLELMVLDSNIYSFLENNKTFGYCIINNENVLIEFFVVDNYLPRVASIFEYMLNNIHISDIYCKSFDSVLLNNCLLNSYKYNVIGKLFRHYIATTPHSSSILKIKKSKLDSKTFLLNQDNSIHELFETEEQLCDFIEHEDVFEFYKNNEFVGCGMIIRTKQGWDYCDLGVWVDPLKRGNNIGSQILRLLRENAISRKLIPSCGCAIDKIASQKAIQKSGFISLDTLIHFIIQ